MDASKKLSIPQVLNGESLLITGGTGFVGKVLLEKILRCCPGVDKIFMIVRSKKGNSVEKRMKDLLENTLFDRCRAERGDINWCCGTDIPERGERKGPVVVGISGDLSEVRLGLSDEDRTALETHVSVIFHSAATVKFNDPLRQATLLNTRGTREVLDLASRMPNLKAFLHVSTVYAHVTNHKGVVEERIYEVPIEPEDVIKAAEELYDEDFEKIVQKLAANYKNTYLCTKALSERMIELHYRHLPIAIYRPGIVGAIHRDPIPGWSEGYQGPSIPIIGSTSGLVGTLHCGADLRPEILPVDHVVSAILAIVWATVIDHSVNNSKDIMKGIPIYNHVSSKHCNFTWEMFRRLANGVFSKYEGNKDYAEVYFTESVAVYEATFYVRLFFAKMADSLSRIQGKESNMANVLQKVKTGIDTLRFFMNNEFTFSDVGLQNLLQRYSKVEVDGRGGVSEEKMCEFDFDISKLDWKDYISHYMSHLRIIMNSQDPRRLEESLKRNKTFRVLERTLLIAGTGLSFGIIYVLTIGSRWLYMQH